MQLESLYQFLYSVVMSYLVSLKYVSFVLISVILVFRKIIRTVKGGRFRRYSIFIPPILYILFSIAVSYGTSLLGIVLSLIAFVFGIYISFHTTRSIVFFSKNNILYYKRPGWVVAIWSLAFLTRLALILFFPSFNGDLFTVLLFLASGLIIGESFWIVRKNREILSTVRMPKIHL
ncbi:TVG0923753 [Thermoplasma volcanium GSS1]|uniref:TVG0923753 protein n=1 Tax=Thermoplasma volcanium (strain ATCC 51530 / DSM 4299 / JCM 9571 / NBRC 15438 / GSS1) TaxID=273116 RepID=Q97AA7_THEVO|nr:hypothetical protein [Thermoplasma volcanium]BAB60045.1 TVG0923753 [Thermoplasma volcanium GSS1]